MLRREIAEAEVLQSLHGEAGLIRATPQDVLLKEMHHRRESFLPIRRGNVARIENARPALATAGPLFIFRPQLAVETQAGCHHDQVQGPARLEPAKSTLEGP